MKKIFTTIAVLAASFMSSSAYAAGAVDAASFTSGTAIDSADCMLLTGSITPSLSANVHAGFRCSDAFGVIQVGACHEGGSRDASTITCAITDNTTTPPTYNDATCTSEADTFEIADRRFYTMSSSGGSIATAALGEQVPCADAELATAMEALSN